LIWGNSSARNSVTRRVLAVTSRRLDDGQQFVLRAHQHASSWLLAAAIEPRPTPRRSLPDRSSHPRARRPRQSWYHAPPGSPHGHHVAGRTFMASAFCPLRRRVVGQDAAKPSTMELVGTTRTCCSTDWPPVRRRDGCSCCSAAQSLGGTGGAHPFDPERQNRPSDNCGFKMVREPPREPTQTWPQPRQPVRVEE